MEDLNAAAAAAPQPRRARPGLNIFNLLAGLFLALSCLTGLCYGTIFAVPFLVPEPFRVATMPSIALIPTRAARPTDTPGPTPTNTSSIPTLPPTWTPTATLTPTSTPGPTEIPSVTPTFTPLGPTGTPLPTLTLPPSATPTRTPSPTGPTPTPPTPTTTRSPFAYTLQNNAPTYLTNFANTAGCKWQGIAGQVFNTAGQSQISLLVHLEGGGLNIDTLTGSKPEYGPSGFEFFLTDVPKDTTNVFRVQLRTTAGTPLSDVIVVPTFANPTSGGCPKNLALVNFAQNH